MARSNRNDARNTTPTFEAPADTTDVTTEVVDAETLPATTETETKATRPSLLASTGEIVSRPSTRTLDDLKVKKVPTKLHPAYMAIAAAPFNEVQDLVVDPADEKAMRAILRRAGQANFLNVGMTVAPETVPDVDENGNETGKVVISWVKRPEKKRRKAANTTEQATNGHEFPTPEDAAAHNADVEFPA